LQLTENNLVLLKGLTVPQCKKLLLFYLNRNFITVVATAATGYYPNPNKSKLHNP